MVCRQFYSRESRLLGRQGTYSEDLGGGSECFGDGVYPLGMPPKGKIRRRRFTAASRGYGYSGTDRGIDSLAPQEESPHLQDSPTPGDIERTFFRFQVRRSHSEGRSYLQGIDGHSMSIGLLRCMEWRVLPSKRYSLSEMPTFLLSCLLPCPTV